MRLAIPLAIVALAAALLAGCGDSGDGGSGTTAQPVPNAKGAAPAGATAHECMGGGSVRATGLSCEKAQRLVKSWKGIEKCAPGAGASRSSCPIEGGYRCLAVVTAKGVSVSCARPGRSIAFIAEKG